MEEGLIPGALTTFPGTLPPASLLSRDTSPSSLRHSSFLQKLHPDRWSSPVLQDGEEREWECLWQPSAKGKISL